MTKQITASIEPQVNCPSIFEIWFRVDGALVGRGNITFNDRGNAERFLSSMLNPEQFDVKPAEDHSSFITTTKGMAGWFAVQYWWNTESEPDLGGFWEPYETGFGRYSDEARAIEEAQNWAEAEGIRYQARETAYGDNCLRSAIDKIEPKPTA